MRLEGAAAELRPRAAYAAVDFGFHLVRAEYPRLVATAACFVLPPALLLAWLLGDRLALAGLLVWWGKPVWERALLQVLGRTLFGEPPSWREVLVGFPGYGLRDLLPSLTFRRLAPMRSFDLPVAVLEGSTGRARRERLALLRRGPLASAAIGTLFVCVNVEGALALGLLALAELLTPALFDWSLLGALLGEGAGSEGAAAAGHFFYWAGLLAEILVGPFYVGAGFSLYLHRRSDLEAWDLELAFRRLAARASRPGFRVAGAVLAVVLGLVLLVEAPPGRAAGASAGAGASMPETALTPETARATIEAVLADEAFHARETLRVPRFVLEWQLEDGDGETGELPAWLVDLADGLSRLIGSLGEILLVSGLIVVLALVAVQAFRLRGGGRAPARSPRRRQPTELFGLEVTEESLPEEPAREALAAARAGRTRAALALLYRAALARLVLRHGAELSRGLTEGECLAVAGPLLPDRGRDFFASLTEAWVRCAYGHVDPDPPGLERLCREWPRFFGSSSPSAGSESPSESGSADATPADPAAASEEQGGRHGD